MTRQELIELANGEYLAKTEKNNYHLSKFSHEIFGECCTLRCTDRYHDTTVVLHPEKKPALLSGPNVVCAGKTIGEIGLTGELYLTNLQITSKK
jgi:hypothetical protein